MIEFSRANIRGWSLLGSCGTFGLAACELPQLDDNVVVMTADLRNFSGLKRFSNEYPDKFYNMGICEQNMIGVASGLTRLGYNSFVTTYATFTSMRCADQVRINMGYLKSPIKLVGTASGINLGIFGATHMSVEDIAVMRSIPNITVVSPADCTEIMKAMLTIVKMETPVYLRLSGAMNTPIVYREDYDFEIGKAITLNEGNDIAIIATGSMVYNSLKAAKILEENELSVKVINMHTIKPIDIVAIKKCCEAKLIVTVEEHSKIGGLGGAVAEVLSPLINTPPHLIIGLCDEFKTACDYSIMIEKYGLSSNQIAEKIIEMYKGCNIVNEKN